MRWKTCCTIEAENQRDTHEMSSKITVIDCHLFALNTK
jgi:hypothetical protein